VRKKPFGITGMYTAHTEIDRKEFMGKGSSQEEAVQAIRDRIDFVLNAQRKVTGSSTIDFNVKFATDLLADPRQTFYAKLENINGQPKLIIASADVASDPELLAAGDFKRSALRNQVDDSGRATPLPGIPLTAKSLRSGDWIANGRYTVGKETQDRDGNRVFDLTYHSTAHTKSDKLRLNQPAFTLGTAREVDEHGGGIGPRQHWQDLMQEGQPQELVNRYLAIDAENDVDAIRAAIQAISRDPALGANSKSRLLGQIGMIIKRHRLPIGRSYYTFMQQYMEEQDFAETVEDVRAGLARIYRRLAPKIERNRDSFLAGQLYDELENYAELHGAEGEFKRMINSARNRAHMEYDTNPGGFQNWFWFLPFEDDQLEEGLGDTLKSLWREIKTYVVDFVANAVGLPDDQRREVFVKAGNTFSNEVIKLLANHPARDKLIPMVREIGGYMAKARTLKELNSLMDKAELFLADVDAGKFDPPVAKTLPSFGDRQGMTENASSVSDKDITDLIHDVAVHLIFNKQRMSIDEADPKLVAIEVQKAYKMEGIPFTQSDLTRVQNIFPKVMRRLRKGFSPEVKDSEDIDEQGVTEGTDDIKKRMSKLEALALVANRAGDDAKCKMYQQKIQSLKQKLSQRMAEGWSDQGNPTPYSVYIDGREWRAYKSDEQARRVAEKVQANLKLQGRDQTVTIAPSKTKRVQENISREPKTARERDAMINKIQRMMTQDRNPANLQIMKKGIEILQTKYRDLKEDSAGGEAVEMAIMRRILVAHTDLIVEFGLDKVVAAIEEVAYDVGDVDEIGSSDVSGWVRQVERILGVNA
jgi:hypothetical protein